MSTSNRPLIPEKYLDVPSQRLYYLSIGLLCQAIKVVDFTWSFATADETLSICKKWLLVDFIYCAVLAQLRIPRLTYSKAIVILQIGLLWFFDGLMFGGISLNLYHSNLTGESPSYGFPDKSGFSATPEPFNLLQLLAPLTFGLLSTDQSGSNEAHLLGQHTVRMSPISTAQLNFNSATYCLSPPSNHVLIPVLLNNTNISSLKYSIQPLGSGGKVEYFELSAKDLKNIEQNYHDNTQSLRSHPDAYDPRQHDEYDGDEYDDDEDTHNSLQPHSSLQKTQALSHIWLSKPGIIQLERVVDASGVEARIPIPSTVTVAPCPQVEFVTEATPQETRCAGDDPDLKLMISISGIPPLGLRWSQTINGRVEQFLVEGIDGNHGHQVARDTDPSGSTSREDNLPQNLTIPLTVSLNAAGNYLYTLQEITDGVGNIIRVDLDQTPSRIARMSRSLRVLHRPAVSFKHCSPGSPASLIIGSETTLPITLNDADEFDSPWEVSLRYQPPTSDDATGNNKRLKPWKKTLKTRDNRREVNIRANTPGDYMIVGVRGKWCTGDVLSPETCRVVEKPLPTADIKWKKIHECSGDTGVSASLSLRGTPPFQVHYRVQRDNEPPRELSKTFSSSRGELTLQPERSGHYIFTFVQMSDANYNKVELKGPSIDQIIHPLGGAEFVEAQGMKRNKKSLNSCEGDKVDVDVALRGTGPWNLEIQTTTPKGSESFTITGIETPRKTLQVPIPQAVNQNGGTFEIDIVNVEDAYGCKRPITVPGVSVSVKRIKPTARFYGIENKRRVTVLENERASLPLRLTGDGPWRVGYRRTNFPQQVLTATLNTPNDNIQVTDDGNYELISVMDSQCPGAIVPDASTFQVDWTPRPSARLSTHTRATFEASNGSFILPPICEGTDDHVDLDLSGRPPFQITYNVAQSSDIGGTKILDQPTFSSIQPRTRFQLQTSISGRMFYEVKQIGDAAYPLKKDHALTVPRSKRLLFEQRVAARPSATFATRDRLSYCMNDAFVPLNNHIADGAIILTGAPPFTLQLSVKSLAASHTELMTVETSDHTWKLDLPSYTFQSIGPHLVTIESILDASNCAQAIIDPLLRSIWVDVAETAAIVPIDRREDFCVGDVSQFQLEGIPPWSIGYRINGKSYTQEAKISPFSLLQQQSGEFTITSIAHQQKMCKAAITDLHFTVHPLPSARVGHGKRIYEDIHEGDQAEIVFTLIGEPPFTFTYQRSEPSSKKGGKPGKILETHTVSRVLANEYTIFSALEGTWTVTSISDRYCRYPHVQPDFGAVKHPH
ncbi:hypothetical protein BD779DRAFT_1431977 [Infundibulicybe gibba]|nr:hypothetical protein BD779DRAFT_1431977 [Infundibulicybe gibba]